MIELTLHSPYRASRNLGPNSGTGRCCLFEPSPGVQVSQKNEVPWSFLGIRQGRSDPGLSPCPTRPQDPAGPTSRSLARHLTSRTEQESDTRAAVHHPQRPRQGASARWQPFSCPRPPMATTAGRGEGSRVRHNHRMTCFPCPLSCLKGGDLARDGFAKVVRRRLAMRMIFPLLLYDR